MKKMMLAFTVFVLTISAYGCSNYTQAARGYAEAALQSARDVEDLNLDALKAALCATPLSAIIRNPEFAGPLRDLCIGGNGTTVEEILNEAKK